MQQSHHSAPLPYDVQDLFRRLGVSAPVSVPKPLTQNAATAPDAGLLTRVCKDTERTKHLLQIAGKLIAQGWTTADAELACLSWNQNNDPPLDEQKVRSTVQNLAKTHARNHGATALGATWLPLAPLFDPAEASVALMLRTMPQPRVWLLTDCLPLGVVGMLVAPGGTGKSQLMLQLGVSVAAGVPLADHWEVAQKGSALLLLAEDDNPEIHRRLHVILNELQPTSPQLSSDIRQNLFVKSLVGRSNLMTVSIGSQAVTATDYVDRLLLTADQIPDLKLLVIDPAARFRGGNENSADDATRFIEELERLSKRLRCTVLVCQHVNKASMQGDYGQQQGAVRGSSALTDGVRWQMNLSRPSEKETTKSYRIPADQRLNYLIASVPKNNYAPPQPEVLLHRKPSGYLVSALSARIPITLADRIEDLVQREANSGHRYSINELQGKFGGKDKQLLAGMNGVRDTAAAMVKAGRLVRDKDGKLSVPSVSKKKEPRATAASLPSRTTRMTASNVASEACSGESAAALSATPGAHLSQNGETRTAMRAAQATPEHIRDSFLNTARSDAEKRVIEAVYATHVQAQSPMADTPMEADASVIDRTSSTNQGLAADGPISDHRK